MARDLVTAVGHAGGGYQTPCEQSEGKTGVQENSVRRVPPFGGVVERLA